jgi:hypothetical protein
MAATGQKSVAEVRAEASCAKGFSNISSTYHPTVDVSAIQSAQCSQARFFEHDCASKGRDGRDGK